MERYILYSEKCDVRKDFQEIFGIDLDSRKYEEYTNLEDKWNAIIRDVYGKRKDSSVKRYYSEFAKTVRQVCIGNQSEIIRSEELNCNLKFHTYYFRFGLIS